MTDASPQPLPLDHLAERGDPDAAALVLRSGMLTYRELRLEVAHLAGWLADTLQPGDRVASWASKGAVTCLLPLAAARAGMVHVPINPLLKRAQAQHILADSETSLLVANDARLQSLGGVDEMGRLRFISEQDAVRAAQSCNPLPPSAHDPDQLAALLYTSGSTGLPKGVMLSHANLWLGAASVATYLELDATDATLAVLPLSFDYGQNQLLSTWYAGGRAIPLDYLFAKDVVRACKSHQVTTLAGVPPLWVQLCEADWPSSATRALRRITNSGGALTPDLIGRLQSCFPDTDIVAMYGLTEAFRSTYLPPSQLAAHPTSIGKSIPFAEVLVVDEDGRETVASEEGELVHCGPLVAKGYWRDPQRTAERFKPAPAHSRYGGTAVWSGDRVVRDREGLLYFVGRRDAMIKSSGNRISPHEIETAAVATGLVRHAVALGVPDERFGQAIHLHVEAVPGRKVDTETLRRELAEVLPNFMQPQVIRWVENMPLNQNGKLDRALLQQRATV